MERGEIMTANLPFSEKLIKKYTGEGDIEFTNYMPRSKTGTRDLEIKLLMMTVHVK